MFQHYYTERLWRHLGRANAMDRGTVAQGWGADFVGTAAAVAYLNDCGLCATAETVCKLAGQSRSTTGGKLRRLSVESGSILDRKNATFAGSCDCPSSRALHFRIGV